MSGARSLVDWTAIKGVADPDFRTPVGGLSTPADNEQNH